jgi:hypothetical protein
MQETDRKKQEAEANKQTLIGLAHFTCLVFLVVGPAIYGHYGLVSRKMKCVDWVTPSGRVKMVDPLDEAFTYTSDVRFEFYRPTFPESCWFNGDNLTHFINPTKTALIWASIAAIVWGVVIMLTIDVRKWTKLFFENGGFVACIQILCLFLLVGGAVIGSRYVKFQRATCTKYSRGSGYWRAFYVLDGKDTEGSRGGRVEYSSALPDTLPASCWVNGDDDITFYDPKLVMIVFFVVWCVVAAYPMYLICRAVYHEGARRDPITYSELVGLYLFMLALIAGGCIFFVTYRTTSREMLCSEFGDTPAEIRMIDPANNSRIYTSHIFKSEIVKPDLPAPCWYDGNNILFGNPIHNLIIWVSVIGGVGLLSIIFVLRMRKLVNLTQDDYKTVKIMIAVVLLLPLVIGYSVILWRYFAFVEGTCTDFSLSYNKYTHDGHWVTTYENKGVKYLGAVDALSIMPNNLPATCWANGDTITFADPNGPLIWFFVAWVLFAIIMGAMVYGMRPKPQENSKV